MIDKGQSENSGKFRKDFSPMGIFDNFLNQRGIFYIDSFIGASM